MRLRGVIREDKDKLKNISKNLDSTMSVTIPKEMRRILESYPDEMKNVKKQIVCSEIIMRGISPTLQNQFENVAHNKGLTTSQLLTLHIPDITARYPDQFQKFEE